MINEGACITNKHNSWLACHIVCTPDRQMYCSHPVWNATHWWDWEGTHQYQNEYIISVIWDAMQLMWRHYNNGVTWAAGCLKLPTTWLTVQQCSRWQQRKHQSSILLSLCEGIHGSLEESPHKGTTLRKAFSCHRADQQVLPTERVSLSYGVPHSYSNGQPFGNWDFKIFMIIEQWDM